jgi:hypothetical protein
MRRGSQQGGRLPCDVEYDQYFVGTSAQLLSAVDRQRDLHETLSQVLATNYRC